MAIPLTIVMLAVIWLILTKVLYRVPAHVTIDKSIVDEAHQKLGKMSYEEGVMLVVFSLTAALWIFRNDLILGFMTLRLDSEEPWRMVILMIPL